MDQMVYNLSTVLFPFKEKPWLEPYDSTTRMKYYLCENNNRLKCILLTEGDEPNILRADDLDVSLNIMKYPNDEMKEYWREYNLTYKFTVPIAESCLRLFSEKKLKIWIGVVVVFSLLTTIEIIEKRIVGIRRTIISCAYDNAFQQFGAILAKGYDICRLPAIRIVTGPWFLQIVVLFTLLCAVLTANYSAQYEKNIDSVKDYSLASSYLQLYVTMLSEPEICQSSIEEMKMACDYHRRPFEERYVKNAFVWLSELFTFVVDQEVNPRKGNPAMYMGSDRYFCQYWIYHAGHKINPTVLKLVNNRLRSFVETSHITPWHRHLEKRFEFDIQTEAASSGGNEFRKIDWKNVEMAFAVWATQLGVAFLVAMVESIVGFYKK